MQVLITGDKGFVGRHFRVYFENLGWDVCGIDLKDHLDCLDLFTRSHERQWDLVIHLAAIVGGRMTIENQPLAVASDLQIDSAFFNWAVRTKQKRVVYYSSSAAYPIWMQSIVGHRLKESDIDLSDIRNPDLSYGWSKLTGEMLAQYAKAEGVNVHIFRPFSGYGEDQDLDYPFPSFIKRIRNKEDPFEIWGDGEQVRDFIHIEDIVEATMTAVDLDIQEPINLGYGRSTSFNELAEIAFKISDFHPEIIYLKDKPIGVKYRCSDNSKMLEFYTPKISLEEGIERALSI